MMPDAVDNRMYSGDSAGNFMPVPDPTRLTTDAVNAAATQIRRDMNSIRELLDVRIDSNGEKIKQIIDDMHNIIERRDRDMQSLRELLETRMLATENTVAKAIDTLHEIHDQTGEQISHVRELHDEKFKSIDKQFVERDVRTTQASGAADDALKAALQAAKELVGAQGEASAAAAVKSETSFTKQIDQIGTIIQTLEKALDARITELKERIDRGEGTVSGKVEARVETRANNNVLIGVAGVFLTVVTIAISLIVVLGK